MGQERSSGNFRSLAVPPSNRGCDRQTRRRVCVANDFQGDHVAIQGEYEDLNPFSIGGFTDRVRYDFGNLALIEASEVYRRAPARAFANNVQRIELLDREHGRVVGRGKSKGALEYGTLFRQYGSDCNW